MPLLYRVIIGNFLLSLSLTFLLGTATGPGWDNYVVWLGLVSLLVGTTDLVIGLASFALKRKEQGKGFLLSGLLLLLIGGSICSNY